MSRADKTAVTKERAVCVLVRASLSHHTINFTRILDAGSLDVTEETSLCYMSNINWFEFSFMTHSMHRHSSLLPHSCAHLPIPHSMQSRFFFSPPFHDVLPLNLMFLTGLQAIACSPDTYPACLHLTSNQQQPKNRRAHLVISTIVVSL